jgi:hypothetical protein
LTHGGRVPPMSPTVITVIHANAVQANRVRRGRAR